MNMYTAPEYRRRGVAFYTPDLPVKAAMERGAGQIGLEAAEMGLEAAEMGRPLIIL